MPRGWQTAQAAFFEGDPGQGLTKAIPGLLGPVEEGVSFQPCGGQPKPRNESTTVDEQRHDYP
jgi:hypothetical protein